jgi:hypothetical protein
MLREKFSVIFLRRIFGRLLPQDSIKSKEARTIEVFAGFPQGVRAENLVEVEIA